MAYFVPHAGVFQGKRRGFLYDSIRAQQQQHEIALPASEDVEFSEIEIARYSELLRQCSRTRNLAQGKRIHSQLREREQDQGTFLGNLTVQMYGKCGHLDDARAVFDRILEKNLYSWSIMIAAYVENGDSWQALGIFRWMQLEGTKPDEVTIISLLRACCAVKSLAEGEKLHSAVLDLDLELNAKIENSLIALYGKCGNIQYARWVFDTMEKRDVVSWNSIIGAYAQLGHLKQAVELYVEMLEQGLEGDRITFATIFGACSKIQGLEEGKNLHEKLQELGLDLNAVGTSLISMYGQCGSVEDARRVFNSMKHRSPAVWNSMVAAYSQNGYTKKALELYWKMEFVGVERTEITYVSALAACAKAGLLEDGREIHGHVVVSGLESSESIGAGLINMYSKCGSLDSAKAVFERAPSDSLLFWTSMLSAFSRHGQLKQALVIFRRMDLEGIKLDHVALAAALGACSSLPEVNSLDRRAYYLGYSSSSADVANSLITSYGRCGSLGDARRVFEGIRRKNVVTWTTMITACARNDSAREAIDLFRKMEETGTRANEVTYVAVLAACSNIRDLDRGKEIHVQAVEKKLDTNVIVGNSLVQMYGSCGCCAEAREAFDKIAVKNAVSWSVIVSALSQNGRVEEAIRFARRMLLQGLRDAKLGTTIAKVFDACEGEKEKQWCVILMEAL
ncbi:pentatricopeptide repeat-containing protein At3g63370, chloroplastic-like [Selaginella moellendorffii]|uniref:pentatricopeptide repeat-containing protein At3g63370, chloroplastic-like n=1 Tax=Selaginella moellendorffii TaxID=88036 RepID=UPI000D1C994D|nr:pentatricopeptide repeat-containing protein At3g63370, chloroplastic-like [Selaginella moellendorffii]|eukprot:XP_024516763.1 pentatricopeptide repeat-containing protein At3g63370, chloroplastic-like [Selaginella moellendorffii]